MKSPIGKIFQASGTANDDTTISTIINNNAILIRPISKAGSISTSKGTNNAANNQSIGENLVNDFDKRADARKIALEEAKSVLSAIHPSYECSSESTNNSMDHEALAESNTIQQLLPPAPPTNDDTPDLSKVTPKSRSDAMAAAKRRAEERKRATSASLPNSVRTNSQEKNALSPLDTSGSLGARHDSTNILNQMDWFNLLAPVTNPGNNIGWDIIPSSSTFSSHQSTYKRSHSRHGGGLSSHGTPISLDHVGSDGTRGFGDATTYAGSLLTAAGMNDLAYYANTSSASAAATMNSVANSLDEFTGWFDHYSRKYLGTVPGLDGGSLMGESDDIVDRNGPSYGHKSNMIPMIIEEYDPEFGPEELPESQLKELPKEITELDLNSVEDFLRERGMLGMRFEDRGGGFHAMREKSKRGILDRKNAKVDTEEKMHELLPKNSNLTNALAAVPDVFFSPYFDLTDPICFEKLLVVSDEEVAEIQAKEAQLHALAEQKVREVEEVAKKDAGNGLMIRTPPHSLPSNGFDSNRKVTESANPHNQSVASVTISEKSAPVVTDASVITLRKPETFTTHLDTIELALLDQVRSKSDSFFRETNRFSELQHLVTASVDEVSSLCTDLHSLRERTVTNVELVPIMENSRHDLKVIYRVLEAVEDVINSKLSIASLMAAGDHLGAVEAIRLARSLLNTSPHENDGDSTCIDQEKEELSAAEDQAEITGHPLHYKECLGNLNALSKIGEQLNEYEKLVVRNLTNELVETFLSCCNSHGAASEESGNSIDYRSPPLIMLSSERRTEIKGVIQALRLCRQLSGASLAYQQKLCDLISVTVKAIVTECVVDAAAASSGNSNDPSDTVKGTISAVTSMSLEQFLDCINMLFEQVLGLVWTAVAVNKFCIEEGITLDDKTHATHSISPDSIAENDLSSGIQHTLSATAAALAAATDLSEKSVVELFRLRREAHSLVSFDGMRQLWDISLTFTLQLEKFSGRKAYGLRSTLLAQAKTFVERKHEANMSTLVAALDSERWIQCSVSTERQAALNRLYSGRAGFTSKSNLTRSTDGMTSPNTTGNGREKVADVEVEGVRFKVVWSCLLLLEMMIDDVACAAHFQTLATNVVGKISELLRLFNTRSTHLVLGAGAIHGSAKLTSINAKHLAIVTQCIGIVLAVLPHVRAALMAQLPVKQHSLLSDLDKIKQEYTEHNEKILCKLVSIISGIVEHSLSRKILSTNFDSRVCDTSPLRESGDDHFECSPFIDSVITNTKKMYQVLHVMLPPELLRDVFSRIFAYLDHKVPSLYKDATSIECDPNSPSNNFVMPSSEKGKRQLLNEVEYMAKTLNSLPGIQPWHFSAMKVLEQELDIKQEVSPSISIHSHDDNSRSEILTESEFSLPATIGDEERSAISCVEIADVQANGKSSP